MRTIAFMHIPKTAGTAVRSMIERVCGGLSHNFTDPQGVAAAWRLDPWVFADASIVSGHFGSGFIDRLGFAPFTVSFLREPVGRTISHYVFSQKLDLARLPPSYAARMASLVSQPLGAILTSDDRFAIRTYCNLQARYFAGCGNLDPDEADDTSDADLFDKALARARGFDFLGFHHRLREDAAALLGHLGLDAPGQQLRNVNASPDPGAAAHLAADQDLVTAIERANAVDRALYRALAEERTPHADA